MPRNITVTFDDGSSLVYQNAPDDVTPEQVTDRAQREFSKTVTHLDGGRGAPAETSTGMTGGFGSGFMHGVSEIGPSYAQGLFDLDIGQPIPAGKVASALKKQKEYEEKKSPEEKAFSSEMRALDEKAADLQNKANIWTERELDFRSPVGLLRSAVSNIINPDTEEKAKAREDAIKARLKEANVEDTPENRKKIRDLDVSNYSNTKNAVYKKLLSGIVDNRPGVARVAGEMVPGVAATILGALVGGGVARGDPKGVAAGMLLASQPIDVRNRFVNIVSQELAARNLEPTEENIASLYKDDKFLSDAKIRALKAGTASSVVGAVAGPVAGRVAGPVAGKVAGEAAGKVAGSTLGRQAVASGINIAAAPAAEAAAQIAESGEITDPTAIRTAAISQIPFAIPEVAALRRAAAGRPKAGGTHEGDQTSAATESELGQTGEDVTRPDISSPERPVPQGTAEAPGTEEVTAGGLGSAGADAGRPDAGTEVREPALETPKPVTAEDLDQASKVLRAKNTGISELFQLAEKYGVPFDVVDDVKDLRARVRNKIKTLGDAINQEESHGAAPDEVIPKTPEQLELQTQPKPPEEMSPTQRIASRPPEPPPVTPAESVSLADKEFKDLSEAGQEWPKFNDTLFQRAKNAVSEYVGPYADKLINFLDTSKVAQIYKDIPAVREIHEITGNMAAEAHKKILDLGNSIRGMYETVRDAQLADPRFKEHEFNDIAHRSTIEQIDPLSDATRKVYEDVKAGRIAKPTPAQKQVYDLMRRYLALPEPVRNVYKQVREYYDDARERYLTNIEKYAGNNAANSLRKAFLENGLTVYLPLTRAGDYWVSFLDKSGERVSLALDSKAQREQVAKWARKQGYKDVAEFKRKSGDNLLETIPPTGLLSDVINTMRANGASEDMLKGVYETFLDYNHSGSVAQMFRKRMGKEGYNQNVLGSLAQVAPRLERQISRLDYADRFSKAKENFYQQVLEDVLPKQREKYPSPEQYSKDRLPDQYSELDSYLDNHINAMLNPNKGTAAKWASGVTAFNYYMTIAGNASTGLVNLMSNAVVSMPMLEGEFGIAKATKAYARALAALKDAGFDKSERDFLPDLSLGTKATGEYKKLFDTLMDKGVITRALGTDLYEMRNVSPKDFNRVWENSQRILGYVMQNTERFNREVSALAAYMLKRGEGASEQDAINYAVDHVEFVHGPGSIETTAPILKTAPGRVLYSLRRFAFTTLWQQARLLKEASKAIKIVTGKTPDKATAIAAKQLALMYAHSGALLGAKGVPLMGLGMVAASLLNSLGLLGDPDKPFVPEEKLNQYTGIFNKGILDELLGINLSSRASLSDLLWRDDPADRRRSGGLDYLIHNLGGVTYSMGENIYNGFKLLGEGKYLRAAETLSPAFMRNIEQVGRMLYEGGPKTISGEKMTTGEGVLGKPIQLDWKDYTKKFLGFNPIEIAEYQTRHKYLKEIDAQYKDLVTSTKRDFSSALDDFQRTRNPKYIDKAREAVRRWGRVQTKNGRAPNSEDLDAFINSYISEKKMNAMSIDGVRANIKNYMFLKEHQKNLK